MFVYYLQLFISVILLAGQFTLNKLYQSKNGSGMMTSLLYTTLSGLATGVIFFCINGFRIAVTPFSLFCALGVALLCVSYTLVGFRVFSLGSFSVYTMFLMLGGMLLPFLYGMLFLGDGASLSGLSFVMRMAGVVLLAVSMVFPCFGQKADESRSKRTKTLFIVLCLCVFVMNGFVSILSKVHQIEASRAVVDGNSFVFLTNFTNGVLSGIALLVLCLVKKEKPALSKDFPKWQLAPIVAAYAACNGVSYLLQLKVAASPLPASVQYPMITGGSVVLTALAGFLFFREKPDKLSLIGIILSFAATFLFLF